MTKRVETVNYDEDVFTACKKFIDKQLGSLIVTDDDLIVGIITERDLIKKILLEEKKPKKTLVGDIMTSNVKTIHALAPVEKAAELMKKNNIKKLPVVYNNNLIGILTETDICLAVKSLSKFFE